MNQENLSTLVKDFVRAADESFNKNGGCMSFFRHAQQREIDFIIFAGAARLPGGYVRRPLTMDEYLILAETYATIAERAELQNILKPALPKELCTTEASLMLLEKRASALSTLCCPVKFDL